MDALLTLRKIAKGLPKFQCAYLMVATDNQEYLKEEIENLLLFKDNFDENMCFEQSGKGHGCIETRRIEWSVEKILIGSEISFIEELTVFLLNYYSRELNCPCVAGSAAAV